MLFYASTYFQRTALPGTIYDTLAAEFNFTAAQMATLGAAFVYPYAICQLFSGMLADRFSGARVAMTGGLLFLAGIFIFPLCKNPLMLFGARFITGVGASAMYLSMIKEIDRIFGRKIYAVIFGFAYSFGYIGGLLGTLPFERLCAHFNWRQVLLCAAGIALVFYTFFVFGCSRGKLPPINAGKFSFSQFTGIFRNPLSWMIIFCCNVNFSAYFIIQTVFGKKFLTDFAGFSSSGAAAVIFSLTTICILTMLSSTFLTWATGNRRRPLMRISSGLCFCSCVMMSIAMFCDNTPSWIFALVFFLFAASSGMVPIFSMTMQEFNSRSNNALSAAVNNMFGYLAVAVFSQLTGVLLDSFEKIKMPDGSEIYSPDAYRLLFILITVLTGIAFFTAWKIPETKGHYLHLH
jgi:MFS family permease